MLQSLNVSHGECWNPLPTFRLSYLALGLRSRHRVNALAFLADELEREYEELLNLIEDVYLFVGPKPSMTGRRNAKLFDIDIQRQSIITLLIGPSCRHPGAFRVNAST